MSNLIHLQDLPKLHAMNVLKEPHKEVNGFLLGSFLGCPIKEPSLRGTMEKTQHPPDQCSGSLDKATN